MDLNPSDPVGSQIQGLQGAKKVSHINREKDHAPQRQAAQTEDSPDDRISLSDASKKAVAELAGPPVGTQATGKSDLSDNQAALLAQQTAEKLSQSTAAISNQSIQKAVDLFT
jgi:hypothetical protein